MNTTKTFRQSNQISDQISSKIISENLSKQTKIVQPVSLQKKSKCTVSRCICIQLLILFALLVLSAIIIPIIVIVLDSRNSNSPCATTYSQSFIYGVITTNQCTAWRIFTTGLTCTSYSMMHIYGSNDPTGITVTDSEVVTAIAIALRYNTTITATSNGLTWKVGGCNGAYEITATTYLCNCASTYSMRPCHPNPDWGGLNGQTCGSPSQTMSLHFE